MKAFILEKYGDPLKEAELPSPSIEPHQVLVRMVAAGVNPVEDRTRSGEFKAIFPIELPTVMGGEFSGEIAEIGNAVTGYEVGQHVYGSVDLASAGAFQEFIPVDAANLAPAPKSVDLVEAGGLPVAALTAWQSMVEMGSVSAGQTVLIHGGTGGVGSIAIQVAKHLGATVATTVSTKNIDAARDLGADIVIDYRNEDFAQALADTPVDFVLDTQGGDTLASSLKMVRRGGTVVGISGPPDPAFARRVGVGPAVRLAIAALSAPTRLRARVQGVHYRFLFFTPDGATLRKFSELVDSGAVRPVIDRVLPFDAVPQALDQVLAGGARGKILVSTVPDSTA